LRVLEEIWDEQENNLYPFCGAVVGWHVLFLQFDEDASWK
jgi:hypothetical protein